MVEKLNKSVLDEIVSDVVKKKHIYGAVFCVSTGNSAVDIISASGECKEESQYYIASINKLFISAVILKLYAENKLDIEDKIAEYLPVELLQGLHVYKSREYSAALTIANLLSHTSGLPGYLIDKQSNGKIAMKELESGIDQAWPIDKVIREVKKMRPHFPPGEKGKAKYVDTNHHMLGLVIEKVTREPVNIALKKLFVELELTNTYVCENLDDNNFVPFRYEAKVLQLPLFLTSTKCDIISTAKDQMTFIKAFFNGHFFPKQRLSELEKWNRIFFPFEYGVGIQKFKIPRMFSPFQSVPEMIGHSGSTGSIAFYIPDKDIYITGTINQQSMANITFQTMIRIINKMV